MCNKFNVYSSKGKKNAAVSMKEGSNVITVVLVYFHNQCTPLSTSALVTTGKSHYHL